MLRVPVLRVVDPWLHWNQLSKEALLEGVFIGNFVHSESMILQAGTGLTGTLWCKAPAADATQSKLPDLAQRSTKGLACHCHSDEELKVYVTHSNLPLDQGNHVHQSGL